MVDDMKEEYDISSITRVCNTCLSVKYLYDFSKGNAKYGRKSECKKCQLDRKHKYLSIPEKRDRLNYCARLQREKMPQWKRTYRYIQGKERVEKWVEDNPDKARVIKKASNNRRRNRVRIAGELNLSSIVLLENYNLQTFGNDVFHCEYCNIQIEGTYHLDHIVPVSKGGTNEISNLAVSCPKCNLQKNARSLDQFAPNRVEYFNNRKIG
jgi:5-methylcytosine-specific restriction endonuclease McrA